MRIGKRAPLGLESMHRGDWKAGTMRIGKGKKFFLLKMLNTRGDFYIVISYVQCVMMSKLDWRLWGLPPK